MRQYEGGKMHAHKVMCMNSSEKNENRYKGMKNKAKKTVLKTM